MTSRKERGAKKPGVDAFCQPQLTATDLIGLQSWIVLQLLPMKIVWVKFTVPGGIATVGRVEEKLLNSQLTRATISHDSNSPLVSGNQGARVEGWNCEDFEFTATNLKSKYNHAKFFKLAKAALDRFVCRLRSRICLRHKSLHMLSSRP